MQAHLWFDLAAGRFATKERRDAAAKDRDNVAAKMTAEEISKRRCGWRSIGNQSRDRHPVGGTD